MTEKLNHQELEGAEPERSISEIMPRDLEIFFNPLFEKHNAVMLLINPDSGEIINANIAAQNYYGYSISTLIQMKIQEINILPPDEIAEKCQQATIETVNCFEFLHRLSSGEIRTVEVHSSPITINDKKYLLSIIHDITERKQAEAALVQSHEMLKRTEAIAKVGSWEWEIETDTMTWSEELYRIFQINPDSKAPSWAEHSTLYHPEDYEKLRQVAETAISDGNPYEIEIRVFRKDGGTRICTAKGFPQTGEGGQVVRLFGLFQDITYRKQTEEALRKQNYYLEKAQELGNIGTWELDLINNTLVWTDENCRIFGVPEGSVVNYETFLNKVHPDDREYVDREWQAGVEGKPYDIEHRLLLDGEVKWVREKADLSFDDNGKALSAIGFTQDITDRKNAAKALHESNETLKQAQSVAKLGSWWYDPAAQISIWTEEMFHLFGLEPQPEAIPYEDHRKIIHPDDWDRFDAVVSQAVTDGIGYNLEFKIRLPGGEIRHVNSRCEAEKDDQGIVKRLVGTAQDITSRKQIEATLRRAQKMESIGNLAGGIAHDFNNILSSIIGFTELALDGAPKGTELEDSLQEVYSAGNRAKDLVKQILAFARQSDEKRTPIQPGKVTREVLKFMHSTIPTSIEFWQDIDSDSWIMGNETQVHQVMMNLCTNGAQAMEGSSGVLGVSVKDTVFVKENMVLGAGQGNYIEIKVSDTGPGISPEIIDSIFEPYFTTKGPGEGTGMGLAMVQGVIESYGGKITVDSQLGKGTTFTIHLPIIKKPSDQGVYIPEQLPSGTERILFVDDEAPIAKMGSQALERLGYSVTTRTSSIEARELFQANPNDFDLVVTDMTMPNLTGDKLAVELMKIRPDIPVILCTGYSKKVSDKTASQIGIKAFAYKPIVKTVLAKTVRKVLDEAKSENQG